MPSDPVCICKMAQVILSGPPANWHGTARMHMAVLSCPQEKVVHSNACANPKLCPGTVCKNDSRLATKTVLGTMLNN